MPDNTSKRQVDVADLLSQVRPGLARAWLQRLLSQGEFACNGAKGLAGVAGAELKTEHLEKEATAQ
jgi:hypothetical protein